MIRVLVKSDSRYPVNRKIIKRAVLDTLDVVKTGTGETEVSVFVVGARKMDQISREYLGDDGMHAVLSFAYEDAATEASKGFINPGDGILRLGDIVLCWPQVLLAASRDGVMVDDEVYKLTAHAVRHLLGRHHE